MRKSTAGSSPKDGTRSFHGGITTQGAGGPDKRKPFKSSATEKRGVNPAAATLSAQVKAGDENRAGPSLFSAQSLESLQDFALKQTLICRFSRSTLDEVMFV